MIKKIKAGLEKLKNFSIFITNLFVSTIAYWVGVSISFLLWKLSQLRKKETKKTFWLEAGNLEEDYKRQY
jgi:hypothetical protein